MTPMQHYHEAVRQMRLVREHDHDPAQAAKHMTAAADHLAAIGQHARADAALCEANPGQPIGQSQVLEPVGA